MLQKIDRVADMGDIHVLFAEGNADLFLQAFKWQCNERSAKNKKKDAILAQLSSHHTFFGNYINSHPLAVAGHHL